MKKYLIATLLAALLLTSCSESETDSQSSGSDTASSQTAVTTEAEAEESETDTSGYIPLVKTGENTVRSSNDTIECEYEFRKTDNFIQVTVNYTNISDHDIMANYMPRVFIDGTEVEENTYGDEFYHMTELHPGDVYKNVYEYDLTEGEKAYLVLQVLSDSGSGVAALTAYNYTSDSPENNKEDFTISLS